MKPNFFAFFVAVSFVLRVSAQELPSKPISAEVVDVPAAQANLGIKAGQIKVTYADGHSEVVGKGAECMKPHVSSKGSIGWTQCSGFDRKGYAQNEKLVIHLIGDSTKEFKPLTGLPYIEDWAFVEGDAAIVIKSRGGHGPAAFVRYDLKTGRRTAEKRQSSDEEVAPAWAQPLSN